MTPLVSGISSFMRLCAILPSTDHLWCIPHLCLSYVCFVYEEKLSLPFLCCDFIFICQRFLKGKCLTLYNITVFLFYLFGVFFRTETVQSRYSIVLPYCVKSKWLSGRNTVGVFTCSKEVRDVQKCDLPERFQSPAIVQCTASRTRLEGDVKLLWPNC